MKDIPLKAQLVCMMVSVMMYGFLLRVFEMPLSEASGQNYSYENSFWNVIVTMTTVGYGDFFPKTTWGRIVGVLICLWGVVVVSIFVVTITNMLAFDPTEEKTYSLLQRLSYKEELKRQATFVLAAAYKGRSILKKNEKTSSAYVGSIRNFRKNIVKTFVVSSLMKCEKFWSLMFLRWFLKPNSWINKACILKKILFYNSYIF